MVKKIASIKGVDHIGYAVKDLDSAREYFKALGFDFSVDEEDLLRSVNVCVATDSKGFRIELLTPAKEKSPIDSYLKKIGPTPYHICYETDDMDNSISELLKCGFTLLSKPDVSVPLKGKVCFLYKIEIGMIELIEYGDQLV